MDEPKRHIIEHYPAERLPDELRGPFSDNDTVTVTLDREPPSRSVRRLSDFVGSGKGAYRSPEHALQQLREGRDLV